MLRVEPLVCALASVSWRRRARRAKLAIRHAQTQRSSILSILGVRDSASSAPPHGLGHLDLSSDLQQEDGEEGQVTNVSGPAQVAWSQVTLLPCKPFTAPPGLDQFVVFPDSFASPPGG